MIIYKRVGNPYIAILILAPFVIGGWIYLHFFSNPEYYWYDVKHNYIHSYISCDYVGDMKFHTYIPMYMIHSYKKCHNPNDNSNVHWEDIDVNNVSFCSHCMNSREIELAKDSINYYQGK